MLNSLAAVAAQIREGDVALAAALALLGVWGVSRMCIVVFKSAVPNWLDGFSRLVWQIGALLTLEQSYEMVRGRITRINTSDVAFLHAYRVFDFELHHGIFVEQRLQHAVLVWGAFMTGIEYFYVFAHVFVTLGVLIWVYLRHREHYAFVRNLLMVTTAAALVIFYLYPMAPPRFLTGYGFVDPATSNHLVDAGGAQPNSYTYNPYAAMPSLHVGYALVVSWAVLLCGRRQWLYALAIAYPGAMTFAVLATANHWILDIFGAFATVAGAGIFVGVLNAAGGVVQRLSLSSVSTTMAAHESSRGISIS